VCVWAEEVTTKVKSRRRTERLKKHPDMRTKVGGKPIHLRGGHGRIMKTEIVDIEKETQGEL